MSKQTSARLNILLLPHIENKYTVEPCNRFGWTDVGSFQTIKQNRANTARLEMTTFALLKKQPPS